MTIIVGMICKDGLIIASDSQAGYTRGVEMKRLDYTKIYDFTVDGANVIITGAGIGPFITRSVEMFEERAAETKFHKAREAADLAESIMTEIHRRYIVERGRELGVMKSKSLSSQNQEETTLNFTLMLGLSCGADFKIYTIYPDGVGDRADKYASLGSGSAFAEYLLARLYRDDLTLDEAVRVAVYVIEEVKKVDLHCGGPTQVALLSAKGVERKTETDLLAIITDLGAADVAIKSMWQIFSKGKEALEKQMEELKKSTVSATTIKVASA